ncbi:MAG: Dabb family protein [Clostridiales bacterium]|nr:Dabb family protein [Clostridiales bacterium]
MKHLVLMKFKPNVYEQKVKDEIDSAYAQIARDLPDLVLSYIIRENCLAGGRGMDLLIELTIAKPNALEAYLTHPAHKAISEKYNPYLTERCSFDYED